MGLPGFEHTASISPYSVQMRENTGQNNSEDRHFSRSVQHIQRVFHYKKTVLKIFEKLIAKHLWWIPSFTYYTMLLKRIPLQLFLN